MPGTRRGSQNKRITNSLLKKLSRLFAFIENSYCSAIFPPYPSGSYGLIRFIQERYIGPATVPLEVSKNSPKYYARVTQISVGNCIATCYHKAEIIFGGSVDLHKQEF